ncbi:MAG TPA: pyridoxal phosphate-dependent aminotransferase [Clostridiales bacterium]|nr:pyridoxal phosphate-dependent aminotransferase [Clostridiales bacterium]
MISEKIAHNLGSSSWIRAMFEEGEKLRKIYGPDKVYDFSIGNPETEPPAGVKKALESIVSGNKTGVHRYMSNAGYPDVREKVAQYINKEKGSSLTADNIIMTCGAAGALNVVLKTILNPGEEVIVFSPYFVEYLFYIDNHGGKPVVVPTVSDTFEPDIDAFEKQINSRTKAVIINSPNNPTGIIYSEKMLMKMAEVINKKEKDFNSTIFLIADEPYDKIVYDEATVPSVLKIFKNSIIVNSFSKSLALPGERIGYIAANSLIDNISLLMSGFVFANRTLGFVNAPAIFQKVIADSLDQAVEVDGYKKRRDVLYNGLIDLGFQCVKPEGAFYLFPKALIDDDVEFAKKAVKHNLLVVPGTGFGYPGYFRLSYCISLKTIENSLPAFKALVEEFK